MVAKMSQTVNKRRGFGLLKILTTADVILIVCVGVLASVLAMPWAPVSRVKEVSVWAGGALHKTLSIKNDGRHAIQGKLGDGVVEIRAGQVKMVQAPCINQNCVLSGWLKRPGEMSVCVPNEIIVELQGGNPKLKKRLPFDAITR